MAAVGAVIAIVGAVTGVVGSVMQYRAQKAAFKREKDQREENINIARTAAAQKEVIRLQQLKSDKGTSRARAASYGFDFIGSKSFQNIQQETENNAQKDLDNIHLNFLITRQQENAAIDEARAKLHAAKGAMMLSVISGIGQGVKAADSGGFFKSSGSPSAGTERNWGASDAGSSSMGKGMSPTGNGGSGWGSSPF